MYFLCPQAQDDNEETLHDAAIERELLQDKLQAADASSTLTEAERERIQDQIEVRNRSFPLQCIEIDSEVDSHPILHA
jgi:hypothetical protein